MHSYEAMQEAIQGKTVDHAKALGVSHSLVAKWQEPHVDFTDSGAYNPLDRIATVVETALRQGVPRSKALSPIFYLNHHFGLVCFPLPTNDAGTAVNDELIQTIKEFSDLAQATSEGLLDGRISHIEARKIIREGQEAMRSIGALLEVVKEAIR
jgi:hypothetical protein